MDREKKAKEFQRIVENEGGRVDGGDDGEDEKEEASEDELERKSQLFEKILEVPKEERDRVQRLQVIDRAAAAIAAAQALIKDNPPPKSLEDESASFELGISGSEGSGGVQAGIDSLLSALFEFTAD